MTNEQPQRDNGHSALEDTTSQYDSQHLQAREIAPGAVIERGNTPRLLAQAQHTTFPMRAPSAPPLPEDSHVDEEQALEAVETTPLPAPSTTEGQGSQEFLWLFEYGLEMDNSYLNQAQRLNGLALPYGPATLKGYRLAFGTIQPNTLSVEQIATTYITLLPDQNADAEVWGFLYRVPRRLLQSTNEQPALLDSIHQAQKIPALYQATEAIVHETLRSRDIPCVTYMLTANAQQHFQALPALQHTHNETVQTLATIVREKKFPKYYMKTWSTASSTASQDDKASIVAPQVPSTPQMAQEQNTEPLPLLKEQQRTSSKDRVRRIPLAPSETPRLVFVACYQLLLLIGALTLLILQSVSLLDTPNLTFQAITIPWLVLVYGLIGGSLSGIVTLARNHRHYQGPVLTVTWLARPFIGSVFALLAYLLLNSNLLSFNFGTNHYGALCLLVCTIAGFSEGWLFRRVA